MKKAFLLQFILCFLVTSILSSYCAYAKDNKKAAETEEVVETEEAEEDKKGKVASEEDLTEAVSLLISAQENVFNAAAYQLDGWTTYANIMEYYFDDDKYEDANESTIAKRAKNIHSERVSAKEKLKEAKELIGKKGDSDFYDAVKDYYKSISVAYNLVSEFPEGYNMLTFSSAVKDYKADCDDAYSELTFYIDIDDLD